MQSQKLAVSKITGGGILLETASSVITALSNNILHANYLNLSQEAQ